MKKIILLFIAFMFVAMSLNFAKAQLAPLTFEVRASNFTFTDEATFLDPLITGNGTTMEFDIYILQTNVPANSSEIFRFALGQYYINTNVGVISVADTVGGYASFTYITGSTDFTNLNALPTGNKFVAKASTNDTSSFFDGHVGGYTNSNSNAALGNMSDVQISGVFPGTKVGRFRLKKNVTTASPSPYFQSVYSQMRWRLAPAVVGRLSPNTKIFAYNGLGGTSTEVSSKGTYIVDALVNSTFPVELANFTASANRNSVNLNWSTVSEINNSGFDVERSIVNSQTSNVWNKVGNVVGNGTTTKGNNYSFNDRNLSSGKYNYRLKQIDFNGNFEYFNLSNEVNVGVPDKFELSQNYPNPFNPTTNLEFGISKLGLVTLKIYDLRGKEVATLVNEIKPAGYYSVLFNASNLSSGMYFYRLVVSSSNPLVVSSSNPLVVSSSNPLTAGDFVSTKKMILVK